MALDITDGPTTVVGTALIACAAAALFLARTDGVRLRAGALIAITLLAAFVAVNSLRIAEQASLLRVQWVKGGQEPLPLFEKWNSFSRITVVRGSHAGRRAPGLGAERDLSGRPRRPSARSC